MSYLWFRLKVKAEGVPQPTIHWFKEGKELLPTEEFIIESPEEGVSELTITQVYPDDAGEIVCEAHNELGVATTTSYIHLPGKHTFLNPLVFRYLYSNRG